MEDLDNAALSELKSFIRPPAIVLNVVKAALLLLGHPLDTIRVATPLPRCRARVMHHPHDDQPVVMRCRHGNSVARTVYPSAGSTQLPSSPSS